MRAEGVMRAALASPAEGVAPLCAAVAVLAHALSSEDKFERGEVFPIAEYSMNQVREAEAEDATVEDGSYEEDDLWNMA